MPIIKFKDKKELKYKTYSYIQNKEPMLQFIINTLDFALIKNTLEDADLSEINIYSENNVLIGSYAGYTKYDISATVLSDCTLDIIINFKQTSLQEKVNEIEKANSEALVRIAAIEQLNTVDIDNMTLEEYKDYRQNENNQALAEFLDKSYVTYDNKNYGVSYDDQTEMTINLVSYNLYEELGIPSILEWHAKKEECTAFTKEQFIELIVLVKSFVYPYLQYCQNLKARIYACTTKEDISNVVIDYSSFMPAPETEVTQ